MSGFFKKLFNRITGRGAASEAPTPDALPAPEQEVPDSPDRGSPPLAESAAAPPPAPGTGLQPAPQTPRAEKKKQQATKKPGHRETPAQKPVKSAAKEEKRGKSQKADPAAGPSTKVPPRAAPAKKKVAKAEPARPAKPTKTPPVKAKPPETPPSSPHATIENRPAPGPVLSLPDREETLPQAPVPPMIEEASPPPPPLQSTPVAEDETPAPRGGWFSRLREGLSKSSRSITGSITAIFTKRKLDAATLQDLEDVLIQADLGVAVSERIIRAVSAGRYDKEIEPEEVRRVLADEVAKVLKPVEVPFNFGQEKPFVILVVGVNGAGKTTTIGKLGSIAKSEGYKVMFAACDTFRAAAIEQLTVWGQRIGATTVSRPTGADAAGLAFDALKEAQETGTDILFIDTAGRLQNKAYLMDELDKVVRVIKKRDETAPHAVLLVLDATTGQNAMAQADVFTKVAGVTGLIMTKLDGTARGGILVAIAERFKLPVHAIGVGEQITDLQAFDAEAFARAIAGLEEQ